MSSVIPGRRTQRTTRTTAVRDNENANARPGRISTRAKPLSSTVNNGVSTMAGSKATGSKAEVAVSKRKREVLGENAVVAASSKLGKGKDDAKQFDGVVINKTKISTRQPLRSLASSQQPQHLHIVSKDEALKDTKERPQPSDDHAMAVDPPIAPILPSLTIRRSLVPDDNIPRRGEVPKTRSSRLPRVEEDPEINRVFKKRRTSSEAPEDSEDVTGQHEATLATQLQAELDAIADEVEADPDGDHWDDLDAEDAEDPAMCSEYVVEVFEYYRQIEVLTMPNPNYMSKQQELGWPMRGILLDWLVQLHANYRLLPETLFLAVNLIDRFLSNRVVSLAKLQLVGVAGMFIAAKVEEVISPSLDDFLDRLDGGYTRDDVLQAERYVLKTLDWNLSYPNPVHYLRRISKADDYNVQVRTLGKYLVEIGCLEWRLIAAPPSLMAAAAMWLARLSLGMDQWSANLAHYSGYPESAVVPTANLMLNYVLKPVRHEAFYKKYAHRKFSKVSVFMRAWALQRWQEDKPVNLEAVLPALKHEIRVARHEEQLKLEKESEVEQTIIGHTQEDSVIRVRTRR